MTQTAEISEEKKVECLNGIKNMIWSIIYLFNGISQEEREDIYQEACVFVTEKLIYKYDVEKNVKFSDFSYICIKNFVLRKVNNHNKRARNEIVNSDIVSLNEDIPDERRYRPEWEKIDKIKKLLDEDSPLLKENEKKVLRMIFGNPKITQTQMSKAMGFSFASGVGVMLSRMRKRIKENGILE